MTDEGKQKLTLVADAQGFDEAARKVAKVTQAQAGLREEIEDLGEARQEAAKSRRTFTDDREQHQLGNLATGFVKLTLAITGAFKALRLIPAAGATVAGIVSIYLELKREIAERLRLIEVMRLQSEAADQLRNRQLEQKATLERIAGRRREGGFAGPDVARRVQQAAEDAKAQFTQLSEEDVNLAFGAFGDIEGLSQRDLTDLAIISSFGELEIGQGRTVASLKRQADTLLTRYRERIDRFARTETLQGQGLGRLEFYTGQPTERAQRAVMEGRAVGGAKGTFREVLKELLPPEFATRLPGEEVSLLDRAVALYELFGTAGEFEAARVGKLSRRGITATANELKGLLEVGLADQPGYGAQFLEAVGLTNRFETMRISEFDEILRAFLQIEKEGLPGGGRAKADDTVQAIEESTKATKEAAEAMKETAKAIRDTPLVQNTYNNNVKNLGPSARSQSQDIVNGQNRSRLRRTG